jgi:acetaldehyde dehydrogenase/alcohol dehydrogenase
VQAARLIFDALPVAVADGGDLAARTDMANAATIAGLAMANAFVGVNHALAHAVGARFSIAHGRANGIFLPHVMRYNASLPTKFMPAPGYGAYVAPEKYATLGWVLFGGHGEEEQRRRLFAHVDELLSTVGIPRSLSEAGVDPDEFEAAIPDLVRTAFEDPSIRTNPRMPLLRELETLLRTAYRGA